MTASKARSALGSQPWIAYAAALWALVFAGVHIVWAAGWYVGLDAERARLAFGEPWFVVYDLVVVSLCIIAVPVALALHMPWGRRMPQRTLSVLAWSGTGLLVLRAGASLLHTAYLLLSGQFDLRRMGAWEPWFYVGAVLFGVNLWRYTRRSRVHAT
jgi:hypothetical protein